MNILKTFVICSFFVSISLTSLDVQARRYMGVENFWDAYALQEVIDIIQITSMEFDWYFFMGEEYRPSNQALGQMSCHTTEGKEIIELYEKALERFLSHYPDEPLPYEQAASELEEFVSGKDFTQCTRVEKVSDRTIEEIFFIEDGTFEGDPIIKVELENL